ncbi:UDP-glycosyltransferase [uncultured Christiangramia sp.]|uniref:UDP-glycosyltransferase n=1 Tax=uncultured Christiangramia sp. TaxID=503836 RepID=UPI0025FC6C62|nr:UDP-glycosyltransferase [uncultured Christiangramia sp.]
MSPKSILVVAESIDIDDSSGSKANVALIRNLQEAGYGLHIFHYTRKNIQLNGIECLNIPENRKSPNFFLSRIQRKLQHWFNWNLAKYLEPKFGFSFTFFNDTKSIQEAIRKLNPQDFDFVLTLSKGASFRPHFALLQIPEFHSRWMAYIHDPYPFHYYPEPYKWSEPGFEHKIEFFRKLSEKCRWAAFPSKLLKEWMTGKFPGFKDKSIIIPHQLNEKDSSLKEIPEYLDGDKFNLLHAGNLMKQRSPFPLIEAFQQFLKNNPKARTESRLLLIGNASFHEKEIEKFTNGLEQILVKKYLDFDKMRILQKSVSVNIILESVAEISPFLPGKFPHCIEAEKPILLLGPTKSESRRLLGEGYPYWAKANEVNEIAEKINGLYQLWRKKGKDLRMLRPDLKEYMSFSHLEETLEKLA